MHAIARENLGHKDAVPVVLIDLEPQVEVFPAGHRHVDAIAPGLAPAVAPEHHHRINLVAVRKSVPIPRLKILYVTAGSKDFTIAVRKGGIAIVQRQGMRLDAAWVNDVVGIEYKHIRRSSGRERGIAGVRQAAILLVLQQLAVIESVGVLL